MGGMSATDMLARYLNPQQAPAPQAPQQQQGQPDVAQKPAWMGSGGMQQNPMQQPFPSYGMNPYAGMFGPQQSNMGYGMMGGFGMDPRQMMMGGGFNPQGLQMLRDSHQGQRQMGDPQPQNQFSGMNPMQGFRQMQPQQGAARGGLPQGFKDWAIKNNIGRPQNAQAFQQLYSQYQQQQPQQGGAPNQPMF
jgi:hypothetical protein